METNEKPPNRALAVTGGALLCIVVIAISAFELTGIVGMSFVGVSCGGRCTGAVDVGLYMCLFAAVGMPFAILILAGIGAARGKGLYAGWLGAGAQVLLFCIGVLLVQGGVPDPRDQLGGTPVSPSQELKQAAAEAYEVHRSIVSQVDASLFTGKSTEYTNERKSAESPAYKDGDSLWTIETDTDLRPGMDMQATWGRIKTHLESKGFTMVESKSKTTKWGPHLYAEFRQKGPVESIVLVLDAAKTWSGISVELSTADFPNPPESEWPKYGEEETWKPSVPLWPAGLGPKEKPSPTP